LDSTLFVPHRTIPDLNDIERTDLASMSRKELEELAWRWRELARSLANRAGEDSTTSSRPPSSDDPYRRDAKGQPTAATPAAASPESADKPAQKNAAKPAGKRPGAKGYWRCQPIVVSGEVEHAARQCAACGALLGSDLKRRCVSAHNNLELARGDMSIQVAATRHGYFQALKLRGRPCPTSVLRKPFHRLLIG
jgi:transposase